MPGLNRCLSRMEEMSNLTEISQDIMDQCAILEFAYKQARARGMDEPCNAHLIRRRISRLDRKYKHEAAKGVNINGRT